MQHMAKALFVEGPDDPLSNDHPFVELWQSDVLGNLGLPKFDFIYPINKKFLISMREGAPKMSGASLKLDAHIEHKRQQDGFECAVVAWDLVPGWAGGVGRLCRWDETVEFYRGISRSQVLPPAWVAYAKAKVLDVESRPTPSARPQPTRLVPNAVLPVCMDTMFESLIASDEKAVRQLLGCKGRHVSNWPKNWKSPPARVDSQLIAPTIEAVRSLRPKIPEAFLVRGDMITAKHEWGRFFLSSMLKPGGSAAARSHRICQRLQDIL
jgi:hypothetical protein